MWLVRCLMGCCVETSYLLGLRIQHCMLMTWCALQRLFIERVFAALRDGFSLLMMALLTCVKLMTIRCPKPTTILLFQGSTLTPTGCSSNARERRMGAMMFLCMRLAAYFGYKSRRSKGKQSREALRATPMRIPPTWSAGQYNVRLWAKMGGGGCRHVIRGFTQVRRYKGFALNWDS